MKIALFHFSIMFFSVFCLTLATSAQSIEPPQSVKASQGKYPDFIQIDWQEEKSATYLIRRTDSADNKQTAIITTKPITTTKFRDAQALPNRKYFYAVQKIIGKQESAFSKPVIGYRATVAACNDKDTTLKQELPKLKMNLLIQSQTPDTFMVDRTDDVWFYLLNESSQPVEQIKLSFHLSTDNQLSNDDIDLGEKTIEILASNKSRRGTYPLSIPNPKTAGSYFLILSTSVKNTQITVTSKPIILKIK